MQKLMIVAVLLGSLVVACKKDNTDNKGVCTRAQERYITCVKEVLGPEMFKIANDPSKKEQGLRQCAGDDKTVKMYKTCLPEKSCKLFMDCMTNYAQSH